MFPARSSQPNPVALRTTLLGHAAPTAEDASAPRLLNVSNNHWATVSKSEWTSLQKAEKRRCRIDIHLSAARYSLQTLQQRLNVEGERRSANTLMSIGSGLFDGGGPEASVLEIRVKATRKEIERLGTEKEKLDKAYQDTLRDLQTKALKKEARMRPAPLSAHCQAPS